MFEYENKKYQTSNLVEIINRTVIKFFLGDRFFQKYLIIRFL